ncbi:MAG: class I SAM-dependent methyltransferase family protein [Candidatus Lokiarchaeota archaeon]|nr:class I SAM-dependent methyltransferase family protein [Candidatus Lokiarchaeota archaeon]
MQKELDKDTKYIKINKTDGQNFIKQIKKDIEVIDKNKKVLHEDDFILFPILNEKYIITTLKNQNLNFEIIEGKGILRDKNKFKTLKEALKNNLPQNLFQYIPNSYDIIGEIVILEFDKFNDLDSKIGDSFKLKIADALISVNKKVKTVYEKASEIKGEHRVRDLKLLKGKDKSETLYKENGCTFKLDIKKTFFTPRLVFERKRLASSPISEGEVIFDLFSGVGPIAIQIAKKYKVIIHAFDINPIAFHYLKENVNLNKLLGNVIPYNMDINFLIHPTSEIGKIFQNTADRIIMNLPEKAINYINVGCHLMKKTGGILHYYQFSEKPDVIEKTIENVKTTLSKFNYSIDKILNSKIVKHYSPKYELVVIDLKLKPRT